MKENLASKVSTKMDSNLSKLLFRALLSFGFGFAAHFGAFAVDDTLACKFAPPATQMQICNSPQLVKAEAELAAPIKVARQSGISPAEIDQRIRNWGAGFQGLPMTEAQWVTAYRELAAEFSSRLAQPKSPFAAQIAAMTAPGNPGQAAAARQPSPKSDPRTFGIPITSPEHPDYKRPPVTGNEVNDAIIGKYSKKYVGDSPSGSAARRWSQSLVLLRVGFDEVEAVGTPRDFFPKTAVPAVNGGLPKYLSCGGSNGSWESGETFYSFSEDGKVEITRPSDDYQRWVTETQRWKLVDGGKNGVAYLLSRTEALQIRKVATAPNGLVSVSYDYHEPALDAKTGSYHCVAAATRSAPPLVVWSPPKRQPLPKDDFYYGAVAWVKKLEADPRVACRNAIPVAQTYLARLLSPTFAGNAKGMMSSLLIEVEQNGCRV